MQQPRMPDVVASVVAPRDVELRACLSDPILGVMNILNEVMLDYPDAISFAPGRPPQEFLQIDTDLAALPAFVAAAAKRARKAPERVWRELGQYNRTNGIIADAVAAHLRRDEGIDVPPDAIMVTVGAQEAMAVVLAGLFEPRRDVLLVGDPTYIGITGMARLLGIQVVPIVSGDEGLTASAADAAIAAASSSGRVRAIYAIPDFNNPLGTTLPLDERRALLDVCSRRGVLLIEDNAYGMFAYDTERLPTLKALDRDGTVLYIGSFSKTLFPSLRVGYLVADQRVSRGEGTLAQSLSCVKSLITVNTPIVPQLVVANALASDGGSLEAIVAPKRAYLKRNRDLLLASLDEVFAPFAGAVRWNRPSGGFFVTVTLPCEFGVDEMRDCAANFGVIVCPMQLFSLTGARPSQVRLSFSAVEPPQIAVGVSRLAAFVRERLAVSVS